MNMIKKIALTASILFFVLAQAFSFYVIYISHQEKIELLKTHEGNMFDKAIQEFRRELSKGTYDPFLQSHVVTYFFRKYMPEGSAIYYGEKELFNSSSYTLCIENLEFSEEAYPCNYKLEKINGHYLQIYFIKSDPSWPNIKHGERYVFFHVKDITSLYQKSFYFMIREMLIAFFTSFGMGLLLIYLIKKITKPLQAINEAQRQLIGSMSHELKTPLTAIRGYSETLLGVRLSKVQEEKALLYINHESARLSRLSEKMMELTKLYEPECKILLQEVSIEKLFEAVTDSVGHRISEKGMKFIWEGNFQEKKMFLDEDLMTSFFINLINNSIMASKEGSRIFIGADEHRLWVRDEGCGIPIEEVDKVKKAFYRVDKSRSRKSGNMGLGLALCEQIAAVHQGYMQIESEVGKGTKVVFTERLQ